MTSTNIKGLFRSFLDTEEPKRRFTDVGLFACVTFRVEEIKFIDMKPQDNRNDDYGHKSTQEDGSHSRVCPDTD